MRRAGVAVLIAGVAAVVWTYRVELILRVPAELFGSPHERYATALRVRGGDAAAAWRAAADGSLVNSESVTAPFAATASFPATPAARAWRFAARRGRRITVSLGTGPLLADARHTLFVDLFDGNNNVASAAGERAFSYDADEDGELVLRVQPSLGAAGDVALNVVAVASLQFPVQGFSQTAVQSVFGDSRDSGRREHQGIDIFAPRGTPVLAAADGVIAPSDSNRLGGIVVWQWLPQRAMSLYYAHLDRRAVSAGAFVRAGEVVGYVGNTGNARATAPHLHFGIYARPGPSTPLGTSGAVDPLPYVCDAPCGERLMHQPPPRPRRNSAVSPEAWRGSRTH